MIAAKKLGATAGVNYKSKDWDEELHHLAGGFDVIVDSALGAGFAKFPDICNPGGRIVVFGGTAGNIPAIKRPQNILEAIAAVGHHYGCAETDFKAMLNFVTEHKIVPCS